METQLPKLISIGILFIFVLVSGFWMHYLGKPYGTLLFTVHKLCTLAIIVLLVILVTKQHQTAALNLVLWLLSILCGLFFIASMATGGMMSIQAELSTIMFRIHILMAVGVLISSTWAVYALLARS